MKHTNDVNNFIYLMKHTYDVINEGKMFYLLKTNCSRS